MPATVQITNRSGSLIAFQYSWVVLRDFIGILILVTAIAKAHQLATVPSLGTGILEARWFNIIRLVRKLKIDLPILPKINTLGKMSKISYGFRTSLLLSSLSCCLVFGNLQG
jgi:hypothetical protein